MNQIQTNTKRNSKIKIDISQYPVIQNSVSSIILNIGEFEKTTDTCKTLLLKLCQDLLALNICEEHQVSITIKDILKEKIELNKITERWIERCLPEEYKRKYEKKTVTSSLSASKDENHELSTSEDSVSNTNISLRKIFKDDVISENNCQYCRQKEEKIQELIKKNRQKIFKISLQKVEELKRISNTCDVLCTVDFDDNGGLLNIDFKEFEYDKTDVTRNDDFISIEDNLMAK